MESQKYGQPQIFNFHGFQVHTVDKDSQPWFVLKDVCDVLEIDQVAGIKRRLTDDVISNHPKENDLAHGEFGKWL